MVECIADVQGSAELQALQQGQVDSGTMQFIDFEYGCYNYRGYDFANNWCEYAGFEGDYSRYPDKKQQAMFVTNYLQHQGDSSPVSVCMVGDCVTVLHKLSACLAVTVLYNAAAVCCSQSGCSQQQQLIQPYTLVRICIGVALQNPYLWKACQCISRCFL